jgi:hypothetical protein
VQCLEKAVICCLFEWWRKWLFSHETTLLTVDFSFFTCLQDSTYASGALIFQWWNQVEFREHVLSFLCALALLSLNEGRNELVKFASDVTDVQFVTANSEIMRCLHNVIDTIFFILNATWLADYRWGSDNWNSDRRTSFHIWYRLVRVCPQQGHASFTLCPAYIQYRRNPANCGVIVHSAISLLLGNFAAHLVQQTLLLKRGCSDVAIIFDWLHLKWMWMVDIGKSLLSTV